MDDDSVDESPYLGKGGIFTKGVLGSVIFIVESLEDSSRSETRCDTGVSKQA